MLENGFRHLPVVDGERAIGIVRSGPSCATPTEK